MGSRDRTSKKKIVEKPFFPGGPKAMREYIKANLVYPQEAIENNIEGSVNCRYKINHQGKVVEVFIINGLGYGCEEEAVRLIKSIKFDLPKIPYRVKAFFQKTIRIHFKLKTKSSEKIKADPKPPEYQYRLVPSANVQSGKSYNYTLNMG